MPLRSIKTKLTFSICTLVVVLQSLLACVALVYFKKEFKQNISAQQSTLLMVVSQTIDQKLHRAQQMLFEVAEVLPTDQVASAALMQTFLDSHPGIRSIFDNGLYIFSADGKIIVKAADHENGQGSDISLQQYYRDTVRSGKPQISNPFLLSGTQGIPAIMMTVPLYDRQGHLKGILAGGINLLRDNFLGELSETRLAKHGYLFLVAGDGRIIMHRDRSLIMKVVEPDADLLLHRALQGFQGTEEETDPQGADYLTSYRRLAAVNWILGAKYPLSEAYRPIWRIQEYAIFLVITAAIFSIAVVRFMLNRFTKVLDSLASHLQNLSVKTGNERLFPVEAPDELGRLAQVMNSMVQDEDRRKDQLLFSSTHDALTGLYNRAFFDTEVQRLSEGRESPISVVVADVDKLKECNDTYGHAAGDIVLRIAAQLLLQSFRAEDIIARTGGDEFAVLLPGLAAEKVDETVARIEFLIEARNASTLLPISLSLGSATVLSPSDLPKALIEADRKMYQRKADKRTMDFPEEERTA